MRTTITEQVRQIPEDYRPMFTEAVITKLYEHMTWVDEERAELRMAEGTWVGEERPDDSDEVKEHREKVLDDRSRHAVILDEKEKMLACMARLYLELVPADSEEGFATAAEEMARKVIPALAEELDVSGFGQGTLEAVEHLHGALQWATQAAVDNFGYKPVAEVGA